MNTYILYIMFVLLLYCWHWCSHGNITLTFIAEMWLTTVTSVLKIHFHLNMEENHFRTQLRGDFLFHIWSVFLRLQMLWQILFYFLHFQQHNSQIADRVLAPLASSFFLASSIMWAAALRRLLSQPWCELQREILMWETDEGSRGRSMPLEEWFAPK